MLSFSLCETVGFQISSTVAFPRQLHSMIGFIESNMHSFIFSFSIVYFTVSSLLSIYSDFFIFLKMNLKRDFSIPIIQETSPI